MGNMMNFNIKVRCGKKTSPEIIVSYFGNDKTILVGNFECSQDKMAEWIEEVLLNALKVQVEKNM